MDTESSSSRARRRGSRGNTALALVATVLAVIAVLLALFQPQLRFGSASGSSSGATVNVTDCIGVTGPQGLAGLSAYDVWLSVGNTGTEQDFLDSLVGEPGKDGQVGSDGFSVADATTGTDGADGASAYQLWLDAGNTGTEEEFLASLQGAAGSDGANGINGDDGTDGLSAFELWRIEYPDGTLSDFMTFLEGKVGPKGDTGQCTVGAIGPVGPQGIQGEVGPIGPQGEQGMPGTIGPAGPTGPACRNGTDGISGLGDSGSFWDETVQGFDGLISNGIDTAYPMYLGDADTANNRGITVERCEGDAVKPAGYPYTPKSCLTFTHPGVYNIAFSAQLWRTRGGDTSVISIWLKSNTGNVPLTNTDVTMQSNGQKLVAAWNFFVPVTCNGTCTTYQLMWSATKENSNLWYQAAQTNPARPAIPSIIVTVNQVK